MKSSWGVIAAHFSTLKRVCQRQANRGNLRLVAAEFICAVCDLPEKRCQCEKYCILCQSTFGARLCEDGQYYCLPCREACDLQAQV
jgi:hypothetical protein